MPGRFFVQTVRRAPVAGQDTKWPQRMQTCRLGLWFEPAGAHSVQDRRGLFEILLHLLVRSCDGDDAAIGEMGDLRRDPPFFVEPGGGGGEKACGQSPGVLGVALADDHRPGRARLARIARKKGRRHQDMPARMGSPDRICAGPLVPTDEIMQLRQVPAADGLVLGPQRMVGVRPRASAHATANAASSAARTPFPSSAISDMRSITS